MTEKVMKAVWWQGRENSLSLLKNKEVPSIQEASQVKIKVAYSGICGSDIHYMSGEMGKKGLNNDGVIMGHEFSGTVVEAGMKSKHKVGDRVCVNPNFCCGNCSWNKEDLPHFCPDNKAIGVQADGGWAQYCVVEDDLVYKLPDNVSLEQGALGEPYSCVLRGWKRLDPKPHKDARVLVQGAGLIGSLFCILLDNEGYKNVTVAEIHENRRTLCRDMKLGFDVVNPQEIDLMLAGKDLDIQGFHIIIDCTGNTNAVKKALDLSRRGGKILVFGCCAAGKTFPMEPYQLFWKELTILGSFINPFCFHDTMDLLEELAAKGYLDYKKLGVKVFSLEEYNEALKSIKSGEASKAMFKF